MIATLFSGILLATFTLNSPHLEKRGQFVKEYTCAGNDISPELNWQGAPIQTKSFAITVVDPDAQGGHFTHWIVYNIPASLNHLAPGMDKEPEVSRGILQGVNHFGKVGYSGPCPPTAQTHSYVFTLYALNAMLPLKPGASEEEFQSAIAGHVIKQTRMTCHFTQ